MKTNEPQHYASGCHNEALARIKTLRRRIIKVGLKKRGQEALVGQLRNAFVHQRTARPTGLVHNGDEAAVHSTADPARSCTADAD